MVLNWLLKRVENTHQREAQNFLLSLQGAPREALEMIHASAMFWGAFYRNGDVDLYAMDRWIHQGPYFPATILKTIKALQKKNKQDSAVGLMVWLFSARALLYPDLRLGGRQIWREFQRSSIVSEHYAFELCSAADLEIHEIDFERFPDGLEPEGF